MNDLTSTISGTNGSGWALPAIEPDTAGSRPGRSADDLGEWRKLVREVAGVATANNWSKAEVSRRAGVAEGTLNQWFSGKYEGRLDQTNRKVRLWLESVREMDELGRGIPEAPAFLMTRTAKEVTEALVYAQMMPDMVVITLAAGQGKTAACENFCAIRPHAFLVTMSPYTRTVHGMLMEIAASLGVATKNPATIHRAIGERLKRNGRKTLLIVDEAQNLVDTAVDQLRSFLDIHKCGVALVGNQEIYDRFKKRADGPSYAQIKRRFGKRLQRLHPYPEDITAYIDAWGVTEEASRRLLTGIGNKPGALGQIEKTMRLAGLLAAGENQPIAERHIRAAWQNRSVEE